MAFLLFRSALVLSAAAAVLGSPASPQAETLSEMLNQRIVEAQQAEADRQFEVALSKYSKAFQISADSPQAKRMLLKKRAGLYEQINMFPQAEADLTAAFKVEPFDPKAFADRGYFYMRRGRYSEALDDFIGGSRAAPEDAMFPYGAGRVLVAKHDDANAIKFFNEAMQIAPRDGKLYLARAEAHLRLQHYQNAADDYDRAIAIGLVNRDHRYFAFLGRGYASLVMADLGAAVRFFDRALDIAPDASNVLLLRGHAFERQGARDLALRDYERAAAGMTDLTQAREGVARLRAGAGDSATPVISR